MGNDDIGAMSSAGQECPALKQIASKEKGAEGACEEVNASALIGIALAGEAAFRRMREEVLAGRSSKVLALVNLVFGLLMTLGVLLGYSDGNDGDDIGCTVAKRPRGSCHGAQAGKSERDPEEKIPGAGGSGDGDPPRLECLDRAERCMGRRPDGNCRVRRKKCWAVEWEMEDGREEIGDGRMENGERAEVLQVVPPQPRYLLQKGFQGWRLVFGGNETVLWDDKAVSCVAVLLLEPPLEPIHGSELAHRAFGDAVVEDQRNLGMDDAETVRKMAALRAECQAVIDDEAASELERGEARAELERIDEWARKHLRGTEANEQRQVRALRQNIRRLLEKLRAAREPNGRPNEVLRAFGEHLERYLWVPSGRGGRGRNVRVRGALAGRFTYEPPPGVVWRS